MACQIKHDFINSIFLLASNALCMILSIVHLVCMAVVAILFSLSLYLSHTYASISLYLGCCLPDCIIVERYRQKKALKITLFPKHLLNFDWSNHSSFIKVHLCDFSLITKPCCCCCFYYFVKTIGWMHRERDECCW